MTDKEYRDHVGISRSQLWPILSKTPLHFKYNLDNPDDKDSQALAFGRAAHKYILEKRIFNLDFAVAPECDRRIKEGKETYAAFVAESAGKEVITAQDYETIKAMSDAIDDPFARTFLTGITEEPYFWTDKETGEPLKVRVDCIAEYEGKKYIVDYKTTDSCADGHFESSVRKFGYKFQAGMYREGVFQNTFDDYGFAFVAQEKKAPYACRVYVCNEDFLIEGYEQFRKALSIFHWCNVNGCWYGYEGSESMISELVGEGDC